jgi:hypothetical protein
VAEPLRTPEAEERLCQALRAGADELLGRVTVVFATEDEWVDGLRAAAHEIARFLQEDPRRARMMTIEVLSAGQQAQAIRDGGMSALIGLVDQGRAELDDPDSMTRATAEGIGGAIYNRVHLEIAAGRCDQLVSMVPELMYSAVLPYLGTEAAMAELQMPPPPPTCVRRQ